MLDWMEESTVSSSLLEVRSRRFCQRSVTIYEPRGHRGEASHTGQWQRCGGLFLQQLPTDQAGYPRSRIGNTDRHCASDLSRTSGFSASRIHAQDMAREVDHRNVRQAQIRSAREPEPSRPWNERFGNQCRACAPSAVAICILGTWSGYRKTPDREEEHVLSFVTSRSGEHLADHNP